MNTLLLLLDRAAQGDLGCADQALALHVAGLRDEGRAEEADVLEQGWAVIRGNQSERLAPKLIGTYRYGQQNAQVYVADGVRGMAISSSAGPEMTLRVAHDPLQQGAAFTDYNWRHDDAAIILSDPLSALYVLEDGRTLLDHHPSVLGLGVVSL